MTTFEEPISAPSVSAGTMTAETATVNSLNFDGVYGNTGIFEQGIQADQGNIVTDGQGNLQVNGSIHLSEPDLGDDMIRVGSLFYSKSRGKLCFKGEDGVVHELVWTA